MGALLTTSAERRASPDLIAVAGRNPRPRRGADRGDRPAPSCSGRACPPGARSRSLIGSVGRMTVGEVVLAWVFTISYTAVGWWAPMALALITLVLWPVDTEGPDSLTHLPRLRRFEDFLDGAIGRTRHGLARGGVLVAIDLDNFGPINKDPLLGQAIGDEVLAEIGRRLREPGPDRRRRRAPGRR